MVSPLIQKEFLDGNPRYAGENLECGIHFLFYGAVTPATRGNLTHTNPDFRHERGNPRYAGRMRYLHGTDFLYRGNPRKAG